MTCSDNDYELKKLGNDCELKKLDNDCELEKLVKEKKPAISTGRQRALVFIVFMLLFFCTTFETSSYSFYPSLASSHGLSALEIGVVFGAFDAARLIAAPIAGSVVSLL